MSYEKDKIDSFITSASASAAIAAALVPYVTSNSLSAAIAGINLAPYVTSDSLSAAVATDTLTVRGGASVSATLSAGRVTVAGRPVGLVLIGHANQTNVTEVSFSGSWSDFYYLELSVVAGGIAGGTPTVNIFTDGGTSSILSSSPTPTVGASSRVVWNFKVYGVDNAQSKVITGLSYTPGFSSGNTSATNTAGFVNCIRFTMTATSSFCVATLYGWRKA